MAQDREFPPSGPSTTGPDQAEHLRMYLDEVPEFLNRNGGRITRFTDKSGKVIWQAPPPEKP